MKKTSVKNRTQTDYKSRINKVFDFIEKNIDQEISLDELASVSNFSKYHFSRIILAITGETPFEFIRCVRLEKAWHWIYGSWFPDSEYQPADGLPYEVYPEPPEDGNLTVKICVPVVPV